METGDRPPVPLSDEEAWNLLEPLRWPDGVACLRCQSRRISHVRAKGKSGKPRRLYECTACAYQFTITTGTIFHNSHLPLAKWFQTIALCVGGGRVSTNALARDLGVHYRTAKHALRLVQAGMRGEGSPLLAGMLERLPRQPGDAVRRSKVSVVKRNENSRSAAGREAGALPPPERSPAPEIHSAVTMGVAAWDEEQGAFRPDWSVRSRSAGRTHTIGFVVPDLVHSFFGQIATGLLKRIRTCGYSLLICSCGENAECERQEIEDLLDSRVDALVLAPTQSTLPSFPRIDQKQIPLVLVDREVFGVGARYVGVDDEEVGRIAVTHLLECGCRRIAHIRGPEISTGTRRFNGYAAALQERGLRPRTEYVVKAASGDDLAERSGYEAMRALLALDPPPDGVFCFNDSVAIGAMSAVAHARIRVPRDMAIIGVGNELHTSLLKVPLTSIDQKSSLIGEHAAQMVLRLLGVEKGLASARVLLHPSLVVRQSTIGFHGLENLSRWGNLKEVPGS